MPSRNAWWTTAYCTIVVAFLASVAAYYRPVTGFTFFIEFPEASHARELPILHETPHHDHAMSGGYDGQFYAQLALDPLLTDPAIDRAMDNPPYRGRRILFSWTAYVLGLGRPQWILQAYAIQNVLAWIMLAWLLCRWLPPSTFRIFVLWCGCLLSHGLIASVRYALPDGPSTLLLAAAVALAESKRPVIAAMVIGLAGLGRETLLLGTGLFAGMIRRRPRSWLIVGACAVVALLPLALWLDYLRSIYRSMLFASDQPVTQPLTALVWKLKRTAHIWSREGFTASTFTTAVALLALMTQVGCVVWGLTRSPRILWAWAAAPFVLLMAVIDVSVWNGSPGAFTRVLLPLAIGANVILATRPSPWWLIALANLSVLPAALWFLRIW